MAGLRFFHADGSVYGAVLSPAVVDVRAKACRALVAMGFREGEVKAAIGRVPADPELALELVLRRALRELGAR